MTVSASGLLLVDKPAGSTTFQLVRLLRKRLDVRKIGHGGTLDPIATGLVVLLVGREYTRQANLFLQGNKEYIATFHLGVETDTYDTEGKVVATAEHVPSQEEIDETIVAFQGAIDQIPPMHSAKKHQGKKLYELARKGQTVERAPVTVHLAIELLHYDYPLLALRIRCSKGTYIRSLAQDMGKRLHCGAHMSALQRTALGSLLLENAIDGARILDREYPIEDFLAKHARTYHRHI